jgi:hypothetical protein
VDIAGIEGDTDEAAVGGRAGDRRAKDAARSIGEDDAVVFSRAARGDKR